VQKKKVQVLEFVPMDLLNKAENITMTNISILYNINWVPLTICVTPPLGKLKQQGLDVEEKMQEEDTFVCVIRKKKGRKAIRKVVIGKVNTRMSSGNLLIPRSFQFHAVGKRRMVNDE